MTESDLVSEGQRLVDDWLAAQEVTKDARNRLRLANNAEREVHDVLAKWLMPHDAKPGEKIAVWSGNVLAQVEVGGVVSGDGDPRAISSTTVTLRSRTAP